MKIRWLLTPLKVGRASWEPSLARGLPESAHNETWNFAARKGGGGMLSTAGATMGQANGASHWCTNGRALRLQDRGPPKRTNPATPPPLLAPP